MKKSELIDAVCRICEAKSLAGIRHADLEKFGKHKVYSMVYRLKRSEQAFAESLDAIRGALKLQDTHYLIMADQVQDVVSEATRLKGFNPKSRHGPYCRTFRSINGKKVFCSKMFGHLDKAHEFCRGVS